MVQETAIGIQGSKGSNNEIACQEFCKKHNIKNPNIKYLITTKKVLEALENEQVQLGVFAVHSSNAGLVGETKKATNNQSTKQTFKKIDEITLPIHHNLLAIKKLPEEKYTKILSHEHALKEHKEYLTEYFPKAKLVEFEDTALAAEMLSKKNQESKGSQEKEEREKTLVIAPTGCAKLFNLTVIKEHLPTKKEYTTTFYLVEKSNR